MVTLVSKKEALFNSNVITYNREPMAGIYSPFISNSIHLAYTADGVNYTPLFNDYGILFPKATFSVNNSISAKGAVKPYIFRLPDGTFGIIAVRIAIKVKREEGKPDIQYVEADDESKGKILFWHSEDLFNFSHETLLDLGKNDVHVNEAVFVVEDEKYSIKWCDENGIYYSNDFNYNNGVVTPGIPFITESFTIPKAVSCMDGVIEGNLIEVDETFGMDLLEKWTQVESVSVEVPKSVTVKSANELKNVKATVIYSDGSIHEKMVNWNISGVDFSRSDTYTVKGTVEQDVFPFPMDSDWGDPVIMYKNNKYYYIATNDKNKSIGFIVREANSVQGLFTQDAKRATILDGNKEKGWVGTFWAPEFHHIDDELYIFFTLTVDKTLEVGAGFCPQSYIMKLKECGDIMKATDWDEPKAVVKMDGVTPVGYGGIALDMTYFEAGKQAYVVWSYRMWKPVDSGSMIYIATIDKKEPWKLTSEPVLMTRPVYGWENVNMTDNNEGPYALISGDIVYITYSGGAAYGDTYVTGVMYARIGTDMLDMNNWTKLQRPVMSSYSVEGEFGPGHNAFFVDKNGDTYVTYHAHTPIYGDSSRLTGIRRVHFSKNNTPIFDMSTERDLKDELKHVSIQVTIGD